MIYLDEKRVNSLKRGTNLLAPSTPLQVNSPKCKFNDAEETNSYPLDEPYELNTELDEEPIKSPTTIVSDESIFTSDYDLQYGDESSSDEDNDDDNDQNEGNNNQNNQKPDDLVG